MNCDLALKRKSQIFSIMISLLCNLGFERPNHFFLLISFTRAFFVKPNHIFSWRKPHFLGIQTRFRVDTAGRGDDRSARHDHPSGVCKDADDLTLNNNNNNCLSFSTGRNEYWCVKLCGGR